MERFFSYLQRTVDSQAEFNKVNFPHGLIRLWLHLLECPSSCFYLGILCKTCFERSSFGDRKRSVDKHHLQWPAIRTKVSWLRLLLIVIEKLGGKTGIGW